MKTRIALLAAAASLAFAPLAHAGAAIEINYGDVAVSQTKNDVTSQNANAALIAVGAVSGSNLANAAVNAVNLASVDLTVADSAAWLGDLDVADVDVGQLITDETYQTANALSGMGGVTNSNVDNTAANLANSANVTVSVGCGSC